MELQHCGSYRSDERDESHEKIIIMKALKAYRELKDCLVRVLGISESEAKQRIITQIHFSQFDIRQARRKA